MKPIYLDYAATTPTDERVGEFMEPYLSFLGGGFGNAGSLHHFGQRVQSAVDTARKEFAQIVGANFKEIFFAPSATQANNLVILGIVRHFLRSQSPRASKPRIICSSVEHSSVLEPAKNLVGDKITELSLVSVDGDGRASPEEITRLISPQTLLVSIMRVNNETGTIQPIKEIARVINKFRAARNSPYPLFHCDAAQAHLLDLEAVSLGVDFITFSSHKMYGPKGAAALYMKKEARNLVAPIIYGGGQEDGFFPGTENVPAIVGFVKAAALCAEERKKERERLSGLSQIFFRRLQKEFPDIEINGKEEYRSPHILNVFIPGAERPDILLDIAGIAASGGAACSQKISEPSYVLAAMGHDSKRISSSVRFSFGRFTSDEEIDEAVQRIIMAFRKQQSASD